MVNLLLNLNFEIKLLSYETDTGHETSLDIIRYPLYLGVDKVWMYKEMMMNNDNLESNLLTSSFIENT